MGGEIEEGIEFMVSGITKGVFFREEVRLDHDVIDRNKYIEKDRNTAMIVIVVKQHLSRNLMKDTLNKNSMHPDSERHYFENEHRSIR